MRLSQITEGRDAPLYHGTQMINLLLILKEDVLDKGIHWGRPGEPDGVRLTRSLKVARSFAEDAEIPGGVIELSQTRLAQRYKMTPYRDVDGSGEYWSDESEEVVITGKVQPLSRYMTGMFVSHDALNGMLNNPDDFQYFYDEQPSRFESPDEIEQLVMAVANHPLRKDMDSFMSSHGPR